MRFWQKAKRYFNAAPAALVLLVAACGGGGGDTSGPQTPPSAPPTASFTVSSATGTVPLSVTFTDTSSAGTSAITSWEWDLGDGTTSTERNPAHEYIGVGNYDVSLTVTTSAGSNTEVLSSAVTVDASPTFIEPETIATYADADEGDILAAENQVLAILEEGLTQADMDAILASAEANGALFQAFDQELLMVQFLVNSGDELAFRDFLDQQTGVMFSFLNRVEARMQISNGEAYTAETYLPEGQKSEKVPPSLGNISADIFWWLSDIAADRAWSRLANEASLAKSRIAIVDSGFPANQVLIDESVRSVVRIDPLGQPLSDDSSFDPNDWTNPAAVHGYVVSAFALGYNDNGGSFVRGVNPHDDLVSVDINTDPIIALTTDIANGIKSSINENAKVVNISFGASENNCSLSGTVTGIVTTRIRSRFLGLARYARDNDANLVFSSGNACFKQDNQLFPNIGTVLLASAREKYSDYWNSNVLNVGASDSDRRDACFSVMGDAVDIIAPGDGVGFSSDRLYSSFQTGWVGTSFSAPIVASVLSLVRSVNPNLDAPEAKYVLLRNSSENVISFRSEQENEQSCLNRSTPIDPNFQGSATGPGNLLNFDKAVRGALLTQEVSLTALPTLELPLAQSAEVDIEVTVPDSGVTALDLVFLVDQSSSYGDDIDTLQAQANTIIQDLESRSIDIQYAVVGFSDFPISPYGISIDREFNLLTDLTDDEAVALNAIDLLDQPLLLGGFTFPEGQYEALFRSATELSFRDGALPVIVLATDADFHNSDVEPNYPGTGRLETIAALKERGVKVIGILSGTSSTAAARLEELAVETDGAFFRLDSASSEIAQAIADAVEAAVRLADISLEIVSGGPWIESISPAVVNDVSPGETATFTVEFVGQKAPSIFSDDNDYDAYIWARSNGTALLGRYKQNIRP